MDKNYDPAAIEPRWYAAWEAAGNFSAEAKSPKPHYTIMMPPPNVTGELHMGHALYSIQDCLSRWKRMEGFEVLWLPGTDHAAIATQNAIERELAAGGTSKEEMGREAFAQYVAEWYDRLGNTIVAQLRALGMSADWGRLRFTMDPEYRRAVNTAFVELHRRGHIYRGPRIVNWCPRCQSAISDLEVVHVEREDLLYHVRYDAAVGDASITIATVRPETILADTAVAVHPDDERYRHLVGKEVRLPLTQRLIPVIADAHVDRGFGTGALKVTPGHDPNDHEIGARHGLPTISMLTVDGHVNHPDLPEFHGLTAPEARRRIVAALAASGHLVGTETHLHSVGTCDRCGEVIEPLISEQWWCRMEQLAGPAISAVETGEIRFTHERYGDVYLNWMRNLRDWCISRQLWLGHRIPVFTCPTGHQTVAVDPPTACAECGAEELVQDPDVLDTWFSSALWPFATLGWPEATDDLKAFYPTQTLSTAREIIFLWVSRMIMLGIEFMGRVPFTDVIIHAVVQDPQGQRMSKSKGTGVDPLELVRAHGADATRYWCLAVSMNKQDVRFAEEKIAHYRGFANKLWNATRLVMEGLKPPPTQPTGGIDPADRWILHRLATVAATSREALEGFDFSRACDAIEDFVWHDFCDWYLEIAKFRARDENDPMASWTALLVLEAALRLLHPFMPFITEELWQTLPAGVRADAPSIMQAPYPALGTPPGGAEATREMESLFELVRAVRNARQAGGHRSGGRGRLAPAAANGHGHSATLRYLPPLAGVELVESLAGGEPVNIEGAAWRVDFGAAADRGPRLQRELADAEAELERIRGKLANPGFVERAPREVVERERVRLGEIAARVESLRSALEQLGG